MDLPNSVALSTLPGISRTRAASVFKALRDAGRFDVTLEEIVAVCSPRAPVEAVAGGGRRGDEIVLGGAGAGRVEVGRGAAGVVAARLVRAGGPADMLV